jgi:phosphonopyruvate decarboxylase
MDIQTFCDELIRHDIRSGSGVPCSFFKPLVNYMGADPKLDYLGAASEGEAVAIAAGMHTAGAPAFALMQNSGLCNAANPITSMLYIYGMPVQLLVSHRGAPGVSDEPQHERMGVITEELIRLCGIECHLLDADSFGSTLGDVLQRSVPAGWVCPKGTLTGGPPAAPIHLDLETGKQGAPRQGKFSPRVSREEALRAILPSLNGTGGSDQPAVVATTGKLSRELFELDDREHERSNRFYMVGSMGCAAGFGLGIARAGRRKVVVLEGDGALLMKFGSLATIGANAPKGFHHVVIDNGAHDSTGGQPTVSPSIDIAAVAAACGYRRVATVDDPEEFAATLAEHLRGDGPTLIRMLVETGARKELGRPTIKPRDVYLRFQEWLKETA